MSLFRTLRRSLLGAVVLPLFMVGCKPGVPMDVLSESTMEDVIYDYHMAQSIAEAGDSFEVRRYGYVQAVFRKHGITEAEFDSSMVWYSANAARLKAIYERVDARYEAQAALLGVGRGPVDVYANLSNRGDTANIWCERDFYVLRPGTWDNRMTFLLEADTTFYPGDTFLWRFRPTFFFQNGDREAYAALVARFSNDSVVSSSRRLSVSDRTELRLATSVKDTIKAVSGFIYLPKNEKGEGYRMMAVSNLSLIRFHKPRPKKAPVPAKSSEDTAAQRSTAADTARHSALPERRLSPRELREETQPTERTINVVKEKPYKVVPKRNVRRRN